MLLISDPSMSLCEKCEISLSFSVGKVPSKFDYKPVSNTEKGNPILAVIIQHKQKLKELAKFKILVDGSRYGIEVIKVTSSYYHLKQFFLHYDGKRCQLIPVWVRYVIIKNIY